MNTPQIYGAENVITKQQRYHQAEWMDRIVEDTKLGRLADIEGLKLKAYKVQWRYFDERRVEYGTWQEIPEDMDIIIRLRVEEIT